MASMDAAYRNPGRLSVRIPAAARPKRSH